MTARVCAVDGCDNPIPPSDNSQACPGCWNRLDRDLGQMAWLVDELNVTITRQARVALESSGIRKPDDDDKYVEVDPRGLLPGLQGLRPQPTIVKSVVKPLPIDLAASDALELLHATLWPWVREGMESHTDVWFEVTPGVVGLARAMLRLRGWLQGHPDGQLAIEEVAYATAKALRAIDGSGERWYVGICSDDRMGDPCGEELYVPAGQGVAKCPTCSTEHDVAERRAAMLEAADGTQLTLSQMATAVALTGRETVSRKTLEGWVRRGRLVRSGNDGPVATYLVADVIDILRATHRATT